MRPGIWSYVFGGVGLLAFLGTAGLYAGATEFLPLWGLAILWAAWAALLVFTIWLMRMSPAWVLAVPVLSVILLAMLTGILEVVLLSCSEPPGSGSVEEVAEPVLLLLRAVPLVVAPLVVTRVV